MPDNVMPFLDLDILLMRRKNPVMPQGLSERIIAAAVRYESEIYKNYEVSSGGFFNAVTHAFSQMLYVPRPAYVLATVLVMGVSLGVYGDALSMGLMPGITTDELSSFMRIEDRFVASEFLSGDSL